MPYIMVMGSLSAPHLSSDGATVYGLKSEERATLVRDRIVRVTQKGLTLVVVNRLHGLFGYDVVSHSMAMTNANRELVSFSMYKKSSQSSHGHSHSHSHSSHSHSHSSSYKAQPKPQQQPPSVTQKSSNLVSL
ncbi:Uncharacterized protein OBRU01_08328 [Operophtera brumata]|uniref:Uncharacterized protein n=1 Tax=Operophtera brumata TaxID=104452 RepID=A0A0L7LH70_OPEBR|nr:Uncharacterized protein OBRU01_08328 [Operophtera brumata]